MLLQMLKLPMPVLLLILPMPQLMVRKSCATVHDLFLFCVNSILIFFMFFPSGPPKTEAQLKKEAKKREKLEKFQQKKEMEAKKKTQPPTEVTSTNNTFCKILV